MPLTRRSIPDHGKAESTIALINIVFLMLVFFMVAGSLAPPNDAAVTLVDTRNLESRPPADALVITADGQLRFGGIPVPGPEPYLRTLDDEGTARVITDRAVPAKALLALASALRAGGARSVVIVTEPGLP